ncbi:hypothetical protein [Helicobacter pylori]|uniref:hypothetical protein n=1 Tax=Helicobacter pylori TaxID=210 RepID=UPI001F1D694B|nr:hypothetical protein [Helicobacter pylori]
MAYFESITAGRGGLDSYNQALNNQRYANLVLNESMGNFLNTIANAGSLFDNAKIREEALKYQRMRDLENDKKQAQSFEFQKRQAEQSMDFAKRQQRMNEEIHKQNKIINNLNAQRLKIENKQNENQYQWLKKANPNAKASALVDHNANNNAMKTPTTPTKPTTITKEEFKVLYANPFFRY